MTGFQERTNWKLLKLLTAHLYVDVSHLDICILTYSPSEKVQEKVQTLMHVWQQLKIIAK